MPTASPRTVTETPGTSCSLRRVSRFPISSATPALATDGHGVAGNQLTPTSRLDLTVDQHDSLDQQLPGLAAVVDEVGQLEQLSEPDRVVADLDGAWFVHVSFNAPISRPGRSRGWRPRQARRRWCR